MIDLLLTSLVFVPGADCSVTPVSLIELSEPYVRVRDVVETDCLTAASAQAVGNLPIASLSAGRPGAILTRENIQQLVRRRMPALGKRLAEPAEGTVRITYPARETAPQASDTECFELIAPVPADRAVEEQDVYRVSCEPGRSPAALNYDPRSKTVRSREDLKPGAYLGRVSFGSGLMAERGDELRLCSTSGPVSVTRTVEALQPVSVGSGAAGFVRGSDGKAFATTSFCWDKNG